MFATPWITGAQRLDLAQPSRDASHSTASRQKNPAVGIDFAREILHGGGSVTDLEGVDGNDGSIGRRRTYPLVHH